MKYRLEPTIITTKRGEQNNEALALLPQLEKMLAKHEKGDAE